MSHVHHKMQNLAFSRKFWLFLFTNLLGSFDPPITFTWAQCCPSGRRVSGSLKNRPRCTGFGDGALPLPPQVALCAVHGPIISQRLHFLVTRSLRRQLSAIRDHFFGRKSWKFSWNCHPVASERAPFELICDELTGSRTTQLQDESQFNPDHLQG